MKNGCIICGSMDDLTEHHLIPKTRHTNKKTQSNFSREELNKTITLCSVCHSNLHARFSAKQLEKDLNTVDKILNNEEFYQYVKWRRKHLNFRTNSTKESK